MLRKIKKLFTVYRSPFTDKKGVALLAIVLILLVAASLIAVGTTMLGPLVQRGKITETKDIIEAAVDSVISWATANKRLPNSTEFTTAVRNPNDVWTKALVYTYDSALTASSTGGLCGRRTTTYPSACDETTCVAFIIISGGKDFTVDSTPNSSQSFPSSPSSITLADTDIYRAVTLAELKSRAGCYGPTGGRLTILNNELPKSKRNKPYSATVYADGGVPFSGGSYKWCRQENPLIPTTPNPYLTFSPSTLSGDCYNLPESSWGAQAATLTIVGDAPRCPDLAACAYEITFFARDSNDNIVNTTAEHKDNIANKTLRMIIASSAPGGSDVDPGLFIIKESQALAVTVNQDGSLTLGGGTAVNETTWGCAWYPTIGTLSSSTMRSYFEFKFDIATNDGFTFAIMQSANDPANTCGSALGYDTIPGSSAAVEFDIKKDASKNDPNYNHAAIVRDGNNNHGTGISPSCASSGAGCYYQTSPSLFNDGIAYGTRIEIQTNCNSSCSSCGGTGSYAYMRAWFQNCIISDCTGLDDLTKDYSGLLAHKVSSCFTLPPAMNQVYWGLTEGGNSLLVNVVEIGTCFDSAPGNDAAGCPGQ